MSRLADDQAGMAAAIWRKRMTSLLQLCAPGDDSCLVAALTWRHVILHGAHTHVTPV